MSDFVDAATDFLSPLLSDIRLWRVVVTLGLGAAWALGLLLYSIIASEHNKLEASHKALQSEHKEAMERLRQVELELARLQGAAAAPPPNPHRAVPHVVARPS